MENLKKLIKDSEELFSNDDLIKRNMFHIREKVIGVSEWKNIGVKYGYWDFFEKEIKTKLLKKINNLPFPHESSCNFIKYNNTQIYCNDDQIQQIEESLKCNCQKKVYIELITKLISQIIYE
jgi:hypothetical protein